ncbi:MAG: ribosomal protein S18-alanine N-acetyltransferase [Candidatus Eisenbacteria bacterium]|nr:ribosomal protein S18-alanine N-acetyltransferase [Candidatus Eisenbacteria bacterium]
MDPVAFRPMEEEDLNAVAALERELFSDPWPREAFRYDIRERRASCTLVGTDEKGLVAYGVAWRVRGELHIANMAVRRDRWGRGIGGALLDRMLEDAVEVGCRIATLEVRVGNLRAIELYRNHGFREVAIRKGYYVDNGEDALVMLIDLGARPGESGGLV